MALQNTARAKQQSRNRFIILILLVLLVLGGAAFFLLGSKAPQATQEARQARPNGMVAVPILSTDIGLGQRITRNKLTVTFVKPAEVPTDAVLSTKEFIGRLATKNLSGGDYIHEEDFTAAGANQGYSGVARLGKRVVALPESLFQSYEAFRAGDHVDLLSIGTPLGAITGTGRGRGRSLADSATSVQGGGAQPGDPNANARQRRRAARTGVAATNATTATLIAENAEILSTNNKMVILQMEPQDAHVTQLAAASGAVLRVVFRPFNDPMRLTDIPEPSVTTRMPKPASDPDSITVFNGGDRTVLTPTSSLYRKDDTQNGRYNADNPNDIFPVIINVN